MRKKGGSKRGRKRVVWDWTKKKTKGRMDCSRNSVNGNEKTRWKRAKKKKHKEEREKKKKVDVNMKET